MEALNITGLRWLINSLLLLLPLLGAAQVETSNWVFGDSIRLEFSGTVIMQYKTEMAPNYRESYTCYTSPDSNNGISFGMAINGEIWDYEHNKVNSTDITGYSYSNATIMIPVYSTDTVIYLMHYRATGGNTLYLSKLLKNGHNYSIIYQNAPFFSGYCGDQITAVPKPGTNEWWLIHTANDTLNRFFVYTVNPDTILLHHIDQVGPMPFITSIYAPEDRGVYGSGEICSSPDGSMIAVTTCIGYFAIFNFDRCSGTLTQHADLSVTPFIVPDNSNYRFYGCCFSPNGKFLYVTHGINRIFRYNVFSSNIASSRELIYQDDSTDCYGFLQLELGPDNSIYVGNRYYPEPGCTGSLVDFKTTHLSFIPYPDSAVCGFSYMGLDLNGRVCYGGLPNFPAYSARAYGIDSAHAGPDTWYCPGGAPVPIGSPPKSGQVFAWSPSTGLSDPTASQPFASPSGPTLYVLTVTDTNSHVSCNVTSDSVWVFLESPSTYTPTPLHDTLTCLNAVITLGADSIPGFVYSWNPATGLSNPNSPRPRTTVTDTILYTLTVHDPAYHSDCGTWTDSLTVMPDTGCIAPHTDNPLAGRSLGAFFPNPGTGVFFIDHSLQPGDVLSVTCTDLTGREVSCSFIASGSHRHILTLDVPAGVYLAEIKLNNMPVRRVKLMVE